MKACAGEGGECWRESYGGAAHPHGNDIRGVVGEAVVILRSDVLHKLTPATARFSLHAESCRNERTATSF
jgi:hypothetical protein